MTAEAEIVLKCNRGKKSTTLTQDVPGGALTGDTVICHKVNECQVFASGGCAGVAKVVAIHTPTVRVIVSPI